MRRIWGTCVLLLLVGCGVKPPVSTAPAAREASVAQSPDKVWDRLLVVLTDFSLPVENMDRSSWFLRTKEMKVDRGDAGSYVDCGSVMGRALAPSLDVSVSLTVLLRPMTDSTAIRVVAMARGWDADQAELKAKGNPFAEDPNRKCVSRGVLENNVIRALR